MKHSLRNPASLFLSLLLLPAQALAQLPDEDGAEPQEWFQIEILLFRNLAESAQQEESWPTTIELVMPESSYQLPEMELADDGISAFAPWEPPQPALVEEFEQEPALEDTFSYPEAEPEPEEVSVDLGDEELAEEDIPPWLQYTGVPAEETHLGTIRRQLQRRSDFQILDYRAWRQPLQPEGDPVYFRVAAGEQYDDYHELEGYIGFYLKRYLHVDTELWWGEYPLPGAVPETVPEPGFSAIETTAARTTAEQDPAAATQAEPLEQAATLMLEPGNATGEDLPSGLFGQRIVLRAAHMKEQRRMRSDEVHYFDHPLLGVLIRISPWQVAPYDEFARNGVR